MRQFKAFLKKEFLEQFRSGRLPIIFLLFGLFGIMNPAIAKLTPWMMEMLSEQLADSGMSVGGVEITAITSWTQYFKNMPMLLIIFIVMFSGILTSEYQNKTLIHIAVKGMKRWKILTAKTIVMAVLWTLGSLVCYAVTYGYNMYFWDNSVVEHVFFAAFCVYLAGLWLITVISLASVFFRTASAVVLTVFVGYLAGYLVSFIPKLKLYTPAHLMNALNILTKTETMRNYSVAVVTAAALITLNVAAAIVSFNRKSL